MRVRTIGRYVVTDPKVCHGQPIFRGTRILVEDVLEQIANGMAWEVIIEEWRGALSKNARKLYRIAHQLGRLKRG